MEILPFLFKETNTDVSVFDWFIDFQNNIRSDRN